MRTHFILLIGTLTLMFGLAYTDSPRAEHPAVLIGTAAYTTRDGCEPAVRAITFYRHKYTQHRQRMNLEGAVPRVWYQNCGVLKRRAQEWQARASAAHARYVTWRDNYLTLPTTNDWRTAVRITQRVFPGTQDWLLYISHREGGYGPFVMNHQGSGAGGWMQFMASTFYGYNDDARQAVLARGFRVDPAVFVWTHPLGQALTAGYMRYTGRDACHWCL